MRTALRFAVLIGLILGVCFGLPEKQAQPGFAQAQTKPNILVLGTDDNNYEVLREAMNNVNTRIGVRGVTFENFYYSQSLCCPSRASTLLGQYPHNTGILSNEPPAGGWEGFYRRGLHEDTYGKTIDEAGYNTAYFGKLMNGYPKRTDGGSWYSVVPDGFDHWFVGSPGSDTDHCFSVNGKRNCRDDWDNRPFDALLTQKALPVVAGWDETVGPDFAVVSYWNPHGPWEHPKGYDDMFSGARPESPAFAESDVSDKPPFVRKRPNGEQVRREWLHEYREKLRSAAYTDDLIGRVLNAVDALPPEEAQNTYVVFWNDNGYKTGHHRLIKKNTPYREDQRFPLLVRGPDIPPGSESEELVNSVDIRPTLEEMAGAQTPDYVDGSSFLQLAEGLPIPWRQYTYGESVAGLSEAMEARVESEVRQLNADGRHRKARALMANADTDLPAWRGVYTRTGAYHLYLSGASLGFEEFYTHAADPWQLDGSIDDVSESELARRYRERMAEFQNCVAETCRNAGFEVPEVMEP